MGPLSVEQSAVADCRRHKRKISLSSAVVFGENVATVVAEVVSVEVMDFETERFIGKRVNKQRGRDVSDGVTLSQRAGWEGG